MNLLLNLREFVVLAETVYSEADFELILVSHYLALLFAKS